MKIKYDISVMQYMALFDSITRASLKDCIVDHAIIFVVNEGEIAKAIGKNGSNVRRLEKAMNKKIRIVEYSRDIATFIKNLVYPLKVREITQEDDIITIIPPDSKTRGMLIGRGAVHLRSYETVVKRYFPIQELKVT
jgi:N utilization substance protein A